MSQKKRILVLTADAGFGHRSAANAVAAALEQKYGEDCEVSILNPIDDHRAPFFLRDSAADYDRLVRNVPELYRLGYEASDNQIPSLLMERVLTVALYDIMRDLVREHHPDAIVTTYPLYQAPLIAYFTLNRHFIPLITVVTDLVTVHRIWFSTGAKICLVPTTEVEKLALENGLAQSKVHITGIPVSPLLAQKQCPKRDLRQKLGWDARLPTFLAVGSRRVDQLVETLNVLNHFGGRLQVAAVAGKDDELFERLKAIDWHIPAHIYNYVSNMPELMRASDAIICKAGGLIVTELLASGLPLALIDVIPGQEEGNRDYVLNNNAGVMVESPMQMQETLAHWLANGGALLRQQARNARHLGRPRAALAAADLIYRAARRAPAGKRGRSGRRQMSLIELLTRNSISWRDHEAQQADSKRE